MTGVSSPFEILDLPKQKGEDTMKAWNELFVRYGWLLTKKQENVFDCTQEREENLHFLLECLEKAQVKFEYVRGELTLPTIAHPEDKWLQALDFEERGQAGNVWFHPEKEEPKIKELDTYIAGFVRQLNRLGFHTMGSCDGHDRRSPHVMLTKNRSMEDLEMLCKALGFHKLRMRHRENSRGYNVHIHVKRQDLLQMTEKLSFIEEAWIEKGFDFISKKVFQQQLEDLLTIPGESGKEEKIREAVMSRLKPLVDHLTVDHAGNILAEKTYRNGQGPTILVNAHLDTVYEIEKDRSIIKDGSLWSSSKGILGADDRAGVAVLLHLAEHLKHHSTFNGKVKFIFTVEEECGLVGAMEVREYFLWDVDAAIVVDRRGKGDIVTSCGKYLPFCHAEYGRFFERIATEQGMDNWKVTAGGSSDTRVWASHHIQSVNLSAGYQNEHTDKEYLDVEACYGTLKLLKGVFENGKEIRSVLQQIRRGEHSRKKLKSII